MVNISRNKILALFVGLAAIIIVACAGAIGEDVKKEQIVINQYPLTGKMAYWSDPGFKWQMFGKTTTYYKTQQFWFGSTNDKGDEIGNPIPVIFNDASDGMIYGSLRVKLPTDPKYLDRIQTDYNGMNRLMEDLVRPTVVKVVYASGPLMSAFESYAEKKNDLIEFIRDQLDNGVYKTSVKRVSVIDPITGESKLTNIATIIPDSLSAGGYKRSEPSPFAYYGIEIGQVAVSRIAYSDKVNQQIAKQQESNMLIQTARAQSAAAREESIRAEEQGKAAAMAAKWEQEKLKAVEVTKAEQEYEVSRLAALKAKEEAKKIAAEGEAKALANRLLVQAGLDPKTRAEIEKETAIGIAQALASTNQRWVPEVIVMGNGSNGTNPLDAVGLNMLLDIAKKQASSK